MISHPFMSLAQPRDPPRHPLVVHDDTFVEPDIPQHLMATPAMDEALAYAPVHVEHPQHAVVKYKFNLPCYSFYLNMFNHMCTCLKKCLNFNVLQYDHVVDDFPNTT